MTATENTIYDGDQELHEQSHASDGTNTMAPKPCLDARLECYILERAQSKLIENVLTQTDDNDNTDLESSSPRGDTATSQ